MRLRKKDWQVVQISLKTAVDLVVKYHYARSTSNTAVYSHGLMPKGSFMESDCVGAAIWIPPLKPAAIATYPENWKGVLCLSRLVIIPDVPKNACSFLIAGSMRLIDRDRWPCLVTYADEWQGHTGAIYRATNWEYVGRTVPQATYVKDGMLISRKAGPRTRTKEEMLAMGAEYIGRFAKHKYVHIK